MKEKKWDLEKVGTYVFYVAVMLETLFVLLDKSAYTLKFETWDFRITFLLFVFKIATTKYSVKEWGTIIAFGMIGMISYVVTDREEIVRIVAMVAACKDIDIKQLMKVIFYETLVGCLVIVGLSLIGIGGDVARTTLYRGGGIEETRYCLGMGHPNALHCMFLVLLALGLSIYEAQMKWYGYLIVFVMNIGLYLLTDSRTSVMIAVFIILLAVILHYGKRLREKKLLYVLSVLFLVCCVLFSVFIARVGVSIPVLRQIDIRINGRFQWAKSEGGIQFWSLFSNIENQNYFDMGYVKLFYWYGIIPAVLFLLILGISIWNCKKKEAYDAFLVIMTFVAYSMIEAHAVSTYIGRNYVFFYLWMLLFTTDNKEYNLRDIGKVGISTWNRIFK